MAKVHQFVHRPTLQGLGGVMHHAGRIISRKLLHSPKFHIMPVAFLDEHPEHQPEAIECLSGHDPIPVERIMPWLSLLRAAG